MPLTIEEQLSEQVLSRLDFDEIMRHIDTVKIADALNKKILAAIRNSNLEGLVEEAMDSERLIEQVEKVIFKALKGDK